MRYIDFDDGLHETYAKGRRLDPDMMTMWTDAVSGPLNRDEVDRILDLGAGTGRFTAPLATALQARTIALDPSRKMLGGMDEAIPRLQGSAESLPFPDGAFDLVFASMVLHHIEDLDQAASEVRRVLRPAGHLVVRTCFSETIDTPVQAFFPSLLGVERSLLPSRSHIVHTFADRGLHLANQQMLRQRMDGSHRGYADRIRRRAVSTLRMILDEEFEAGMRHLDRVAQAEKEPVPVFENIDLVHFSAGPPGTTMSSGAPRPEALPHSETP